MDPRVLQTDRHRYVVVSPLAEGGMGAIFLGRRISADAKRGGATGSISADVVLKQLLPEHSADPKLIEIFLREARVSASLDHPNIVRTLDLVNAGDDYYIVMEYVRGGDLRSLLRRARRRQNRLSVDSALFIAAEVLGGLSYAHGKRTTDGRGLGIVHRDVTPSNILLGSDGAVKLTDFGIAKAPSQGSVMFKVKGKLGYMSPEQSRGEPVDARTDVFAVGVVLWEALVGERLFVATAGQAAGVFSQGVRAPSKKRGEIGPELDEIVLRALALDPAGRFSSAAEFRSALVRAAERARRTLSAAALAADLRRACGDDSSSWLSPESPVTGVVTLDGGGAGGEGTGVIVTGDEHDDDFDDDFGDARGTHSSRVTALPMKELTSIVRFADDTGEDELPPPNDDSDDRDGPYDNDDASDDAARTRVHGAESIARRQAPRAASPAPSPNAPRAHFEPPVPRPSIPPPSLSDLVHPSPPPDRTSPELDPTTVKPAARSGRDSRPQALPAAPSSSSSSSSSDDPPPTRLTRAAPAPAASALPATGLGPASLAALERNLGGRPLASRVVAVLVILVLIGLGIGLGILLSGPSVDGVPAAPAAR